MMHASLSPRKPGFGPVSVHLRYVLDTLILVQVSVRVLPLSVATTIPPVLHTHLHFNTLRTGDADLRFYITTVQDG